LDVFLVATKEKVLEANAFLIKKKIEDKKSIGKPIGVTVLKYFIRHV